jgi:hypothetical protein
MISNVPCTPEVPAQRQRYSSYQSERIYYPGDNPPQRHELWLPDTDPNPSPRGLLACTQKIDSRGIPRYNGMGNDSHYIDIASSLAHMHEVGFAPVLQSVGLSVVYGTRPYRHNEKEEYIRVSFPPTETFVSLGNSVLEKCGADLRFAALPPGQYPAETFIEMFSDNTYPISSFGATPPTETSGDEYGVHDMLLHAAAAIAIATTDTYPIIREKARQSRQMLRDYDTPYKEASYAVDTFMAYADNGIHVMNCRGIMFGDDHVAYFRRMLGWNLPDDQKDAYQQQLVDTIRSPLSHGFRALTGEVS